MGLNRFCLRATLAIAPVVVQTNYLEGIYLILVSPQKTIKIWDETKLRTGYPNSGQYLYQCNNPAILEQKKSITLHLTPVTGGPDIKQEH